MTVDFDVWYEHRKAKGHFGAGYGEKEALREAFVVALEGAAKICQRIGEQHQETEDTDASGKKAGALECADALTFLARQNDQ